MNNLPPELALLLACGSPPSESARLRVAGLLAAPLNWPLLFELADTNHMLPLLSRGISLQACPDDPAQPGGPSGGPATITEQLPSGLRARVASKALRGLRMAGELARILRAFEEGGLTPVAFKGPTLAWLAYGDLALRDSADLDIFVPRAQLKTAVDLLAADGYGKQAPAWDIRFSGACEIAFRRHDLDCDVDLHWRFSSPYFLDLDPVRAVERSIALHAAGLAARTLRPEDLLLYLCIHAAREGWGGLRFPCDIAGVAARCALNWDDVLRESRRTGAWRALAAGLDIAHDLCEAPVPLEILQRVKRDRAVSAISAQARLALARCAAGPSGAPGGALLHLRMLDSPRARARYIWRRALQPNQLDAEWIHLPESLSAAYYLIRPVRMACTALGRRGR